MAYSSRRVKEGEGCAMIPKGVITKITLICACRHIATTALFIYKATRYQIKFL